MNGRHGCQGSTAEHLGLDGTVQPQAGVVGCLTERQQLVQ